jgi:hypothetical protein
MDARLVNLFDLAEPTAAMREMNDEYVEALNTMLASVVHIRGGDQTGSDR